MPIKSLRKMLIHMSIVILTLAPIFASAEILFEGYSKVLSGGTHIGYYVSRYEFDRKSETYRSIYFLKTNALGGNITESLNATADKNLAPLKYVYTAVTGGKSKRIEASVEKGKLIAKITQGEGGAPPETLVRDIPKTAFFSTFLSYWILKHKSGLKTGTSVEYEAIAEEEALLTKGVAKILEATTFNDLSVYKIENEFKGAKFVSLANTKGEMFATKSALPSIETQLVASANDATKGMSFSADNLKLVFGNIPRGLDNSLVKAQAKPAVEKN